MCIFIRLPKCGGGGERGFSMSSFEGLGKKGKRRRERKRGKRKKEKGKGMEKGEEERIKEKEGTNIQHGSTKIQKNSTAAANF